MGILLISPTDIIGSLSSIGLEVMQDETIGWVIMVCGLMGSFIYLLIQTGGASAFARKMAEKANSRNNKQRHNYLRCSDAQQQSYNNKLNTTIPQDRDFFDISQWIQSAAADHVPQKQITNHPFEISDETTTLMTEKTKQYKEAIPKLNREKTYLFEIIYPENRFVVDYGKQSSLILLAVIDTKTGDEDNIEKYSHLGFPMVQRFKPTNLNDLKELDLPNKEGFVVKFENGLLILP